MVAIPDFATGAMENWGLITFRETALLYDSLETSTAAHQWVAVVITHEIAHQVVYYTMILISCRSFGFLTLLLMHFGAPRKTCPTFRDLVHLH